MAQLNIETREPIPMDLVDQIYALVATSGVVVETLVVSN